MPNIMSVDETCYPRPGQARDISTLWVLVGDEHEYACYVGHGSADWVARFGDKVSFESASSHFPGALKEERYHDE